MQVQEKPTPAPSKLKKYAGVNAAFVCSFFVHLFLLFLLGGAVLQYGRIESKNFTAVPVDVTEPAQEESIEPEAMPDDSALSPQETESTSSSSPPEASSIELLTSETVTSTPVPTFSAATPLTTTFGTGTGVGTGTSGSGKGSGGGSGLKKMASLFGSTETTSEGLTGYLYDLKQTSDRKPLDTKADEVLKSLVDKWDEKTLQKFYKAPNPLTSFQWFIPLMGADGAPKAFNVEQDVKPNNWLIFYQGKVTSNVNGSFRFVGIGDDILLVRFNKKFVFDGGWFAQFAKEMNNEKGEKNGPYVGNSDMHLRVGTWFNVRAGESYPMDVVIGEIPGNAFSQFLLIQQRGREYEKRPDGLGVLLPIFQTSPIELPTYEPGRNGPLTSGKSFSFSTPPESGAPADPAP